MQQEQLKILLIEDDEAFARAVTGMLEQQREVVGSVTVTQSLETALAQLAQSPFDVVILEFFLKDGAGLPNIAVLRAAAPRASVIVVGSEDDEVIAFASERVPLMTAFDKEMVFWQYCCSLRQLQ